MLLLPLRRAVSNDQHNTPQLPQLWWRQNFQRVIAVIGHTCLILSPWSNPAPLTRSWCLWEVVCSVHAGVRFSVQLPPSESADFGAALQADIGAVSSMLSTVDVRSSNAFMPSDREAILCAVEETVGFAAVNRVVGHKLREWLVKQGLAMSQGMAADQRAESEFTGNLLSLCVSDLQDAARESMTAEQLLKLADEYVDSLDAKRGSLHPLVCDVNFR